MPQLTVRPTAVATLLAVAACGPSIDPAAKADIDRRLSLLSSPSQTFPAPATPQPLPLAVGQWVQYKMIDDKGQPAFFTMKVVDELQGAYWLEYLNETYTGRTVTKMHLYLGDRTSLDAIDIRAVKMKDPKGNINEMPPEVLNLMKSTWRDLLSMLVITWQGLPQEDARVPAGVFSQCYKAHTQASWGPFKSESLTWAHPAVPINGLVRSQATDGKSGMELVAFGEKGGGKSEIP
jgi:hypothetical protein